MILGKEPAVVIGGLVAAVSAAVVLISGHGLDDGLQLDEATAIAAPLLAAFGIRFKVWAQDTVDRLAPREVQARVVARKGGANPDDPAA